MELEFELTEEDYINYNIAHSQKSPSIKRSILIQRIFGPIIFMGAPFFIIKFSDIPLWYWITIFGISSVVWLIYYPKYANWEIKRRVKKMLKEGNNENLFNRRKLALTGLGITEVSEIGESNINWDKIVSIEETTEYIYIYISSVSAHIVPKRVFKDTNEQKRFTDEISERINN